MITRGEIVIIAIALAVLGMTGWHLTDHHLPRGDRTPVAAATPAAVQQLPFTRDKIPCSRHWQLLRGLFYSAEVLPPDTNWRAIIRDIERASARAWSCEWGLDPPPTPVPTPPRPTPEGKYG